VKYNRINRGERRVQWSGKKRRRRRESRVPADRRRGVASDPNRRERSFGRGPVTCKQNTTRTYSDMRVGKGGGGNGELLRRRQRRGFVPGRRGQFSRATAAAGTV
jgi:hypothetical protein